MPTPHHERIPAGLVDNLIDLRNVPDAQALILRMDGEAEDLLEKGPGSDIIIGWRAGVDATLDLLVPALKQILLLPTQGAGPYISKTDVEQIIGRVPMSPSERGRWKNA